MDGKTIDDLDRHFVEKRIGGPLTAVQTLLQRDKVVWSRGVLAFPQACLLAELHPAATEGLHAGG